MNIRIYYLFSLLYKYFYSFNIVGKISFVIIYCGTDILLAFHENNLYCFPIYTLQQLNYSYLLQLTSLPYLPNELKEEWKDSTCV